MNAIKGKIPGVVLVLALLTLLSSSCSKESSAPDSSDSNNAASAKVIDLGALELADNEPLRIELSEGRTAVVTAKALPDGSLDIGTVIQAPPVEGKRKLLGMPRVITKPGHAVEVSVGEVGLKFTPQLKGQ